MKNYLKETKFGFIPYYSVTYMAGKSFLFFPEVFYKATHRFSKISSS